MKNASGCVVGGASLCYLSVVQPRGRFRASKAAQSRRGKAEICFPPDPLVLFWSCVSGCFAGRLWLRRIPLNFRMLRKESFAKSPLGLLCGLHDSRRELRGTGKWCDYLNLPRLRGRWPSAARSDEARSLTCRARSPSTRRWARRNTRPPQSRRGTRPAPRR